jgi:hypothetical protein
MFPFQSCNITDDIQAHPTPVDGNYPVNTTILSTWKEMEHWCFAGTDEDKSRTVSSVFIPANGKNRTIVKNKLRKRRLSSLSQRGSKTDLIGASLSNFSPHARERANESLREFHVK